MNDESKSSRTRQRILDAAAACFSELGYAGVNLRRIAARAKMKADKGLMFRAFTKEYVFSTDLDVQEAADAHLILLCRFLTYIDDTQYRHLKGALDLRNGCGHPTGYQPDPVKLQAYP